MRTKEIIFLEKLGYTCEDIDYTLWHDNGRYGDDTYTPHRISLAYKTETPKIKEFKEKESHWQKAESNYDIRNFILDKVYKLEFEEALYEMVSKYVSKRELNNTF